MRTEIPMEWTASAATKRLSWSCTMNRIRTIAAIPDTTAKKVFTFGGCRLTHIDTAWIGLLCTLMFTFFCEKDKESVGKLWDLAKVSVLGFDFIYIYIYIYLFDWDWDWDWEFGIGKRSDSGGFLGYRARNQDPKIQLRWVNNN